MTQAFQLLNAEDTQNYFFVILYTKNSVFQNINFKKAKLIDLYQWLPVFWISRNAKIKKLSRPQFAKEKHYFIKERTS